MVAKVNTNANDIKISYYGDSTISSVKEILEINNIELVDIIKAELENSPTLKENNEQN
ncbi:hypothetical protein ACXYRP_03590 [Mycoplasma sp. 5912]